MADPNTRRVVLLGNTGSEKSSLANILFGEYVFPVNYLPNSGTKLCTSRTKTINGRSIQLIDTPDFFDTDPRSTKLSPELLKCITECAPGPHAFLLVMKMEKHIELDKAVVALTLKYFSEEALKYTTVVFPHWIGIEDYVRQNEDLGILVQKCGGRSHVIDTKYWNYSQDHYRNNQYQVEQLLQTIDQTVRENRGHYTNSLLQEVTSSQNILGNDKLNSLKDSTTGILLGAFLGAVSWTGSASCLRASKLVSVVEAAAGGWAVFEGATLGVAGAVGSLFSGPWSRIGLLGIGFIAGKLSERWSSPTEAVQDMTKFSKEVEDMFVQMKKTAQAMKGFAGEFSNSDKPK